METQLLSGLKGIHYFKMVCWLQTSCLYKICIKRLIQDAKQAMLHTHTKSKNLDVDTAVGYLLPVLITRYPLMLQLCGLIP